MHIFNEVGLSSPACVGVALLEAGNYHTVYLGDEIEKDGELFINFNRWVDHDATSSYITFGNCIEEIPNLEDGAQFRLQQICLMR